MAYAEAYLKNKERERVNTVSTPPQHNELARYESGHDLLRDGIPAQQQIPNTNTANTYDNPDEQPPQFADGI